MKTCHHCRHEINSKDRIGRRDTCANCGADLHCCLNCIFHDAKYANSCREPNADRVLDKEAGNFCEYFEFTESRHSQPAAHDDARARLEALFKRK